MARAKPEVVVTQDPDAPVPREVLALAIVRISAAIRQLATSGLNRKAIVLLVAESSHQSRTAVGAVLDALEDLRRDYTTLPAPAAKGAR